MKRTMTCNGEDDNAENAADDADDHNLMMRR